MRLIQTYFIKNVYNKLLRQYKTTGIQKMQMTTKFKSIRQYILSLKELFAHAFFACILSSFSILINIWEKKLQ